MKNSELLINNIKKGINLSFEESKRIFIDIMSGNMKEELIFIDSIILESLPFS